MSDRLAELWERFRPLIAERLQALEAYASAPASGAEDGSRERARWAAHNLAGSLGSYGRAEGSDVARRLDLALSDEPGTELDDAEFRALVDRLRALVEV